MPTGPFRALTDGVYQAFPAFPSYEGQFGDVVPHLTIGDGRPLNDLRAAEESVQVYLPIDAYATAVTPDNAASRRRALDQERRLRPGMTDPSGNAAGVPGPRTRLRRREIWLIFAAASLCCRQRWSDTRDHLGSKNGFNQRGVRLQCQNKAILSN